MYNLKKKLTKIIDGVSAILFVWILLLILLFASKLDYACKKDFIVNNILLLISFVVFIIILYGVKYKVNLKKIVINYDKVVGICCVLLFFVQVYISYNIFFETGWDSGGFIIPAARTLLQHADTSLLNETYFSTYPNNLFLVNIYYVILKINDAIGVFYGENQLMAIVVCNCVISSFSCWLVYWIGRKLSGQKYAFIGYLFAVGLIGISPWMVICYSDSFALFIPVFLLAIYLNEKINYFLKYLIVFIGGYLGYCIKPQALIVVIAIVIIEIIKRIDNLDKKSLKRGFSVVFVSSMLIIFIATCLDRIYTKEGFDTNSDKSFGLSHFFMMGLDPDRLGVWSGNDVQLSAECADKEERFAKNLEVSKDRLKGFGIWGYFEFLSKKMLTNYNDGTFAWGEEGGFYYLMVENRNTQISGRLKATYYNDGAHFWLYSAFAQGIWLGVILLMAIKSIYDFASKRAKSDFAYLVVKASIVGITIFELMFEARARYLYIYVPIFIILAVLGLEDVERLFRRRKSHEEAHTLYGDTML